MNISDFTLVDFQDLFEVNNDYELKEETVNDLTVISIENFFKNPDDIADILKKYPVNNNDKYYEKMKENNPSIVRPPGRNQLIPSEYLNGVAASLYQLLCEKEYVPFNFSINNEFKKLTEQLGRFSWYTSIFYPLMKNDSNNWNPRFNTSTFVFNICLQQESNSSISFYQLNHGDKQYSTIDSVLEIESLEDKSDIKDKLNAMHLMSEDSKKYYCPEDTDLFLKYFSIPLTYNKLILYKGNNWSTFDYDAEKESNVSYCLNSSYTPNFEESNF